MDWLMPPILIPKTTQDHFDVIKSKIADVQAAMNNSYCFASADFMVKLFSPNTPSIFYNQYISNTSFFDKTGDKYTAESVQKLFSESEVPEHIIFHIEHPRDMHGYVVEKESDGINTWYRIHQSWLFKFTLGQWEGMVPYTGSDTKTAESIEKYGKGKKLTKEELAVFINGVLDFCINFHEPYISNQDHANITVYPVTNLAILEAKKRVAADSIQSSSPVNDLAISHEKQSVAANSIDPSFCMQILASPYTKPIAALMMVSVLAAFIPGLQIPLLIAALSVVTVGIGHMAFSYFASKKHEDRPNHPEPLTPSMA